MPKNLNDALNRAKHLIAHAKNAAMATVNEDGTPHNTPFFLIHDEELDYIYWCSHPESVHSKNIARTSKVFIVIFESNAGGGIYIKADNAHELDGNELEQGIIIHNKIRLCEGKNELIFEDYSGASPQRMYSATLDKIYVNYSIRDSTGKFIKEIRHEISKEQLN